jgi:hypothetical protein
VSFRYSFTAYPLRLAPHCVIYLDTGGIRHEMADICRNFDSCFEFCRAGGSSSVSMD